MSEVKAVSKEVPVDWSPAQRKWQDADVRATVAGSWLLAESVSLITHTLTPATAASREQR